MIDLNKKYTTRNGRDVILYDIFGDIVFGRYYNPALQRWYMCVWPMYSGKCESVSNGDFDLVEVPEFNIVSHNIKKVKYFDIELTVPYWAKWIATDADGELVAFENKPLYNFNHWYCEIDRQLTLKEFVNYDGDWRKSLMEIK